MVVPNVVLFKEIAPHDSALVCRPLPRSFQNPASATSKPFDVGKSNGGPLDQDAADGIASFLRAAATKSISLDKILF